jgi:ribosomal protein S20
MPHHKSCKKRLKTSEKSRIHNRDYTSQMRSNLKSFRAMDSAEEAGAAPLAAALSLGPRIAGKKVALIQSGGNLTLSRLASLLL